MNRSKVEFLIDCEPLWEIIESVWLKFHSGSSARAGPEIGQEWVEVADVASDGRAWTWISASIISNDLPDAVEEELNLCLRHAVRLRASNSGDQGILSATWASCRYFVEEISEKWSWWGG